MFTIMMTTIPEEHVPYWTGSRNLHLRPYYKNTPNRKSVSIQLPPEKASQHRFAAHVLQLFLKIASKLGKSRLLGSKTQRNERWFKTLAHYCITENNREQR